MREILHADQKPKQNHKEETLPALPQEQFLLRKNLDRPIYHVCPKLLGGPSLRLSVTKECLNIPSGIDWMRWE